jgi:Icc protein
MTPTTQNSKSGGIDIIQLTDTHLFKEENGKLLGLETEKSLRAVVEHIAESEKVDAILATGDLAQDGSHEAYNKLSNILSELKTPVFWLAGNHDDLTVMSKSLINKNVYSHKRILLGNWQIVLLNTNVPGKVYGKLSASELDFLHTCLTDKPSHCTMVALHHQPVKYDSKWLDSIGLKNSAEFFAVLARHSNVKSVIWGHVHQEFLRNMGVVKLYSTPSTCVQFEPQSTDFEAGKQDPGYRRFRLFPDGEIESEVIRTRPMNFTVDYTIKGY